MVCVPIKRRERLLTPAVSALALRAIRRPANNKPLCDRTRFDRRGHRRGTFYNANQLLYFILNIRVVFTAQNFGAMLQIL